MLFGHSSKEIKVSSVCHLLKAQTGFCDSKPKHCSIVSSWCNILALVGCYTAKLK